jgi:hypothetical protein
VCLGGASASAVHVETNCTQTSGAAMDCTCNAGEVAISGGANAGTGNMFNAMQAGPSYDGGSASTWRVSCVDPGGNPVACSQPFAVCIGAPYAAFVHVEQNCKQVLLKVTSWGNLFASFDCACNAGEVAISSGASGGADGGLVINSTGQVSCGNTGLDFRQPLCSQPFAVCAASGF